MYVIAGVTGQTGAATADALLAAGKKVRVLVRTAEAGKPWQERGAEVAVLDLKDVSALTAALRNAEGAFLLNPPSYTSDQPFADAAALGEKLAAAVNASGVKRVVVLSSIGAHLTAGTGIIRSARELELAMTAVTVPTVRLRASYFVQNFAAVLGAVHADGVLPSFLQPLDRKIPMQPVRDIGEAAAALLQEPLWQGQRTVELSGSVDWSPNDLAAELSRALDKPVQAVAVPREQWPDILASNGFSKAVVAAFVEMIEGVSSGLVQTEEGNETRRGSNSTSQAVRDLLD